MYPVFVESKGQEQASVHRFSIQNKWCKKGKSCSFSHHKELAVAFVWVRGGEVTLNETRKEELEKDRIGEGEFGWVPTRDKWDESIEKDSKENCIESKFHGQLLEAINNINGELQDEVRDKILEGLENAKDTNGELKKWGWGQIE